MMDDAITQARATKQDAPHPDVNAVFGIVPVKAENLHADAVRQPRHFVERIRFQVGVGLLVCILLPMAVRGWYDSAPLNDPRLINSGFISAIALLFGYYASRSMMPFRGATISTFSLPTISAAFALATIIPIFARIEYSRAQLGAHFLLSVAFFVLTERITAKNRNLRFAVIPGGSVSHFPAVDNVTLEPLRHHNQPIRGVDGIIADLDAKHGRGWDMAVTRSLLAGVPVYHWRHLVEQLCGTVDVDAISDNSLGTMNPNQFYLRMKLLIDFGAAVVLLALLWPLMLLVAIAIKLETPGPAIFRQSRTGYRAKTFTVLKFRTMRVTAARDIVPGDHSHAITLDDDPRITRVGRILRRIRLDELPQLFNVLRLEMSLIGPRPEAIPLTLWYEKELPFYHYRHVIRPGITGWAQVNQGHVAGIDDTRVKLSYDFYYVKYCSFWLDLLICARTIITACTFRGAR